MSGKPARQLDLSAICATAQQRLAGPDHRVTGCSGIDDRMLELKETCQQVLLVPALAREMLPSQEGLFFGGTDYDGWYFQDLKDTVEQIDRCLKFPEAWEFEYHASW